MLPYISEQKKADNSKLTDNSQSPKLSLPVKGRISLPIQLEILNEALHSLLDAAFELKLKTI
ncbi:uncharacterized protein V1477_019429, partial [Vespula maculifrons]